MVRKASRKHLLSERTPRRYLVRVFFAATRKLALTTHALLVTSKALLKIKSVPNRLNSLILTPVYFYTRARVGTHTYTHTWGRTDEESSFRPSTNNLFSSSINNSSKANSNISSKLSIYLKRTAILTMLAVICAVGLSFKSPARTNAFTSNDNGTINFQARLEQIGGAIVPDGNYNVEFKLYDASSSGTLLWTEDYTNPGTGSGIAVKNGYLTANLGSINALTGISSSVWNKGVWLTMNIAGTSSSCSTFGTAPCTADGEMSPRLKITAVPYAFSAGQLSTYNGTWSQLLQFQASPTGNDTVTLPDASGTLCLQTSSACGFATGSGSAFIQGGNSFSAAANLGTNDSNVLNLRTNNATRITVSTTGDLSFAASNTINTTATNSNLTLQANGTGTLYLNNTGTAGFVQIGNTTGAVNQTIYLGNNATSGATNTIHIGDAATATDAVTIGSSSNSASSLSLESGTGTTNLFNGNTAHTIQLATNSGSSQSVSIGSTNSSSTTTLKAGALSQSLTNTGETIQTTTNSTIAFQLQNNLGSSYLTADSSNQRIYTYGGGLQVLGVSNPKNFNASTSTSGGSLPTATAYYYMITALNSSGSQTAAIQANNWPLTTGAGGSNSNTLTWTGDSHAVNYNLYRRKTVGGTWYYVSLAAGTVNYTDTSDATWSSALTPPGVDFNYTGGVYLQNATQLVLDGGTGNYNSYIAYDSTYNYLAINNTNTTGGLYLQSDNLAFRDITNSYANEFNIQSAGQATFQNYSNSSSAFRILDNSNNSYLTVDTASNNVYIGNTGSSNYNTNVYIADSSNTSAVQTATIGTNSNASNSVSIDAGNTGKIQIGNSASAHTINIGATSGANNTSVTIGSGVTGGSNIASVTIGSANAAGSTTTIQGGNGSTAIILQAAASGIIQIGNQSVANTITVGSVNSSTNSSTVNIANTSNATGTQLVTIGSTANTANTVTLQAGGTTQSLTNTGDTVKVTTTSTTAFQIQNSASYSLFTADNQNNQIIIGTNNSGSAGWVSIGAALTGGNARTKASAVAYNGSIYSWGGLNGSPLNTLDIYNTATNNWSTGTAGGTAVYGQTAVVYNGKMYEWGGTTNGTSASSTMYYYNIAGNSWTQVTGWTGSPTARFYGNSYVYGNKMYVVGGTTNGTSAINSVDIYNFDTNAWTTGTSGGTARMRASAVIYNGSIYMNGGTIDGTSNVGSVISSTDIYNITNNSWSTGASSPYPIMAAGSTVYNSKMYIYGGGDFPTHTMSMMVYDLNAGTWSFGNAGGDQEISSETLTVSGTRMYAIGGQNNTTTTNNLAIYDFSVNQWNGYNATPFNKNGQVSTVYNGKLYIWGGNETNNTGGSLGGASTTMYIYDYASGTWSIGPSGGASRMQATGAVINDKWYIWGGSTTGGYAGAVNTLDIYNFTTGTWSTGTAGGTARWGNSEVVYNNKIYIWGGAIVSNTLTNTMDIYDPIANSWSTGTAGGTAREAPVYAVYNDKMIEYSGWTGAAVTNTVDIYSFTSNSWSTGTAGGTARDWGNGTLYNGTLYAVGGFNSGNASIANVDTYNISNNSWSSITSLSNARDNSTVVTYNNKMYVADGYSTTYNGNLSSMEVYDFLTQTPTLLVLGNGSSDPANATAGAIYFNSQTNSLRCFSIDWNNCGIDTALQNSITTDAQGNNTNSGNLTVQGSTSLTGGLQGVVNLNGLSAPAAPTVTPVGTTGSTAYSYTVTALTASGAETIASNSGSTSSGNATLTTANQNYITWPTVSGALSYNIYRTVGGSTQGKIGSSTSTFFSDTGLTASGSAPTVNSTAQLNDYGSALFKNSTDSTNTFQIQNAAGSSLLTVDTADLKLSVVGDINVGTRFGNRQFTDNFESGGFGLWANTAVGSPTVSSSAAHDGNYSASFSPAGSATNVSTPINSGGSSTIYLRFWFKVNSASSSVDMASLYSGGTEVTNVYWQTGSGGKICMWNWGGANNQGPCTSVAYPTPTAWHQAEIEVVVGSGTSGSLYLWVDGAAATPQTGINTGSSIVNKLVLGEDASGNTGSFYTDDVSVDTVSNGTPSSLNVDDSLHVGGTSTLGSSVLVKSTNNTTNAFQLQNSAGTSLLNADTTNSVITVAGTTSTFANLTLTNAHFKSTQTTAPTVSAPTTCGTGTPSASVSGTDSAGLITIVSGGGGSTTLACTTTLTFNKSYGAAPKSVIIGPGNQQGIQDVMYVSSTASGSFTVQSDTAISSGDTVKLYYWVIE